jgi:hypothetical protein
LLDRPPAREDADRHQEHGEHDQHQRDAVDPSAHEKPAESGARSTNCHCGPPIS